MFKRCLVEIDARTAYSTVIIYAGTNAYACLVGYCMDRSKRRLVEMRELSSEEALIGSERACTVEQQVSFLQCFRGRRGRGEGGGGGGGGGDHIMEKGLMTQAFLVFSSVSLGTVCREA